MHSASNSVNCSVGPNETDSKADLARLCVGIGFVANDKLHKRHLRTISFLEAKHARDAVRKETTF